MDKLKEIIAYIIKEYPHKDELSNARLTKLVYLTDWHQAINHKKQVTNISWYFDNYGPYVSDVLEKAKEYGDLFSCESTSNIYGSSKTLFRLKDGKYTPSIKDQEKESVDHIINITKKLNWDEFIKLVYSTHPIVSSNRYSQLNLVAKAKEYTES